MKNLMIIVFMVAAFVLPTMAQQLQNEQPQAQFQSTSTLQGSGSAYSSNPALDADGTASSPSRVGELRRIGGLPSGEGGEGNEGLPDTSQAGDNTPIGDAALPLLLIIGAYTAYIVLRRQRKVIKS